MTTTLSMQTLPRRGNFFPVLLFTAVIFTAFMLTSRIVAGGASSDFPAPPAAPPFAEGGYRGYAVESFGAGFAVPDLELAAATPQALRLAVNRLLFRAATGVVDTKREAIYAAADFDRDGSLSRIEEQRSAAALGSLPGATTAELRLFWGRSE